MCSIPKPGEINAVCVVVIIRHAKLLQGHSIQYTMVRVYYGSFTRERHRMNHFSYWIFDHSLLFHVSCRLIVLWVLCWMFLLRFSVFVLIKKKKRPKCIISLTIQPVFPGYNTVVRIPAGATNIDVRQHSYSGKPEDDNYLGKMGCSSLYLFVFLSVQIYPLLYHRADGLEWIWPASFSLSPLPDVVKLP